MQFSEKSGAPANGDARSPDLEVFMELVKNRGEARRLFSTVAQELANSKYVGQNSALYAEWKGLKERYVEIEIEARSNADDCRSFLTIKADVLVPLSKSKDVTLEEKKAAIKEYKRSLTPFKNCARQIEVSLSKLQQDIEAFPPKLSEAIAAKKKKSNVIIEFLKSIWSLAIKLVNYVVQLIKKIDFSCFGTRVKFEGESYEKYNDASESEPLLRKEPLEHVVEDDVKRLNGALEGLHSTWRMIEVSCNDLTITLDLGAQLTPRVCDKYLDRAEKISVQLLQYSEVLAAF